MDCSTPGFPVHHQLLELAQTHVHRVSDAIQPSFYLKATLLACLLFLTSFPPCLTGFFWECFLNRSFFSNQWLRLYFWKNLFIRCPYNYKGMPRLIHIGILPGWQWTAVIVSRLELSSAPPDLFLAHKVQQWICIIGFNRFPIILLICQQDIVRSIFILSFKNIWEFFKPF